MAIRFLCSNSFLIGADGTARAKCVGAPSARLRAGPSSGVARFACDSASSG
jgi:hypothetical protein